MRVRPNFFIVGAAKAGTTSLANALSAHPDVFIPAVKEPMYFIEDIGIRTWEKYESLYRDTAAAAVGDASTGYLFDSEAPSNIYRFNKDAKIIVVLRNPIDMVYSFWQYMTVSGNEQLEFGDALEDSMRRRSPEFRSSCVGWYANYLYIDRAKYAAQLERYLSVFPREQIKVILFEELIERPSESMREILGFLGVNSAGDFVFGKSNESGMPRSAVLKKLLDKRKSLAGKLIPTKYRTPIKRFLMKVNTSGSKRQMTSAERELAARLLSFEKEVLALEGMLGRKLSGWKVK